MTRPRTTSSSTIAPPIAIRSQGARGTCTSRRGVQTCSQAPTVSSRLARRGVRSSIVDAILTNQMAFGGEIHLHDAGPQPGGREPAPGSLGLVQAFVNSSYDLEFDHGAELLADPAALRVWLSRRGLLEAQARVTGVHLERALAVRDGLRARLIANNGGALAHRAAARLDAAARRAPLTVAVGTGEPEFEPHAGGVDGALATILAAAARA